MKSALVALFIVFALAACRDEEPGDAPPIGALPSSAETPAAAPEAPAVRARVPASAPAAVARVDAAGAFRDATARARAQLDVAWEACGAGTDAGATRCRDAAMLAYDATLQATRAALGDAAITAAADADVGTIPLPATRPGAELAVVQLTGTRG